MAMIYQALEIKGKPGRYRFCGRSDEEGDAFVELCTCEEGHDGPEAARACPDASLRLAALFPDEPADQEAGGPLLHATRFKDTPWTDEQVEKDKAVATKKDRAEHINAAITIAARAAHEANRSFCQYLGDDSQVSWAAAPEQQRATAISHVRLLIQNPAITPAQEHSLWMAAKMHDGWVYGETKDAAAKTHPCIVPFTDLPQQQRFKDFLFQSVVRSVLGMELQ